MVAAGDATGRVVFWHGVQSAIQQTVDGAEQVAADSSGVSQTTVHWHAEALCCLAFSANDAFLLTGMQ